MEQPHSPIDVRPEFAREYSHHASRVMEFIAGGSHDDDAFDELAAEVFEFQLRWNQPLAQFCAGSEVSGWRSIPAVPASAFRDPGRPLACFPPAAAAGYFETSGTTGEARGRHYFYEFDLYRRSIAEGWRMAGVPSGLPRLVLPGLGDHSSLGFMLESLGGVGVCGAPDLCRLREPVVLMGTALAFLHLIESERGPLMLPEGSWAMETGGYKGSGRDTTKRELYGAFEHHLGIPPHRIVNEYGMTELSSQFYSTGLDQPHRGPHWARAIVRDPETGGECAHGEAGYLAIYDLANLGSVIGIATRDLAVRRDDGFELLGRDPAALPRGCSRAADEFLLSTRPRQQPSPSR